LRSPEEQGFRHVANSQTFRGGAGWGNYGVGNGGARMKFADRMGRLRKELAIGLGIGKPMLSDGEREEPGPGAVARTTTGRRRGDDNDDEDEDDDEDNDDDDDDDEDDDDDDDTK
jgi:hypothetical protein